MPEKNSQPIGPSSEQESHAYNALHSGDYETAIVAFKKILINNPKASLYLGLGQALERKGLKDKETVFLTLSWDAYLQALRNNLFSADVLDGLIRLATKTYRFDELVAEITHTCEKNPHDDHLASYLKKITTISLLTIPDVDKNSSKSSTLIFKVLFDILLPLLSIFLIVLGIFMKKYYPASFLGRFSPVMLIFGPLLFLVYVTVIVVRAPSVQKRKNW